MRIAFLGSGEFGLPTLQALAERHTLAGVVSQPDRPAGRGGKLTPTPIAQWVATAHPSVPLLRPEDVNTPEMVAAIHAWNADAMVIIAFGQKLSPELVDPARLSPGMVAINLHASLLPRWRGAAPINWAILGDHADPASSGDLITGNSVISIAQRMDAGLIYGQSRRDILPHHTAGELHDLLSADGPPLVLKVLADLASGHATGLPQDDTKKTRAPKLSRSLAIVDFASSADRCRRTINGLSPWPGVTVSFRGHPLKLLKAHAAPTPTLTASPFASAPPGSIIDPALGLVACGNHTTLHLLEVQPAGKRPMPWKDFANGHAVTQLERLLPPPTPPTSTTTTESH